MLFNIHINDIESSIPDRLSINSCKYADDYTLDESLSQSSTSHMQIKQCKIGPNGII